MAEDNEVRIDNEPDKINVEKIKKYSKKNPWKISTIVLAIIAIILLVLYISNPSGISGNVISSDEAGEKILNFAQEQGITTEIVEVKDSGGFYEVIISMQGQELPLYVTKDGKHFAQALIPLDQEAQQQAQQTQQPPQDVPKNDKPVVELFIMSHCPYGTQAEKGILPVYELLGDKIDSSIKFVYYAMHPSQGEVEEQLNQYCIQEEQNDKFYDYLACFLDKGEGEACLDKTNIDKTKLKTCTDKADEEFEITKNLEDQSLWLNQRYPKFNTHKELNEQYGIGGSPTLVINGQTVSSPRDSASLLSVICNAFNQAPEECNEELSSASPSPGFGYSTTASANSATDAQCI
jgi:protein-disulfide isomerase